ncbi:hypothetical protein C8F01DRAFT_1264657 [Mycena amicta]|nr:hypothetical protein C8F01DRAFT_1264657 [Mycena amicta]
MPSQLALSTLVESVVAALDVQLATNPAQNHLFHIPPDVKVDSLLQKLFDLEESGKVHRIKISIQDAELRIHQFAPSWSHERARHFASMIETELVVISRNTGAHGRPPFIELQHTGSTTFTNGIDAKQGDSTLVPRTRGKMDWPTVVVEAGNSESLYGDADKWMQMSQGRALPVLLVILIRIYYDPARIEMEFLERAAQPNPTSPHYATQVPGLGPYVWNMSSIHPNNISSIGSIAIPLQLIYDHVPPFLTNGLTTSDHIPASTVQRWVRDMLLNA